MREQLQPLRDELIQRCLSIGPWEYNGKPLWHRILDFAMDAGEPWIAACALQRRSNAQLHCWLISHSSAVCQRGRACCRVIDPELRPRAIEQCKCWPARHGFI